MPQQRGVVGVRSSPCPGVLPGAAVTPPHRQGAATTGGSSGGAPLSDPTCLRPEGCCWRREGKLGRAGLLIWCLSLLSSLLNAGSLLHLCWFGDALNPVSSHALSPRQVLQMGHFWSTLAIFCLYGADILTELSKYTCKTTFVELTVVVEHKSEHILKWTTAHTVSIWNRDQNLLQWLNNVLIYNRTRETSSKELHKLHVSTARMSFSVLNDQQVVVLVQ